MPVFDCTTCQNRYEVDGELAGQAIQCPECDEWGRVPGSKAPPKPEPQPPRPARREEAPFSSGEPWFFEFIEGFAYVTLAVGVVVGLILLVVAIGIAFFKDGWSGFLGVVGAVTVLLSACVVFGVLPLLVDIGRSLRLMRPKTTKGGQDAG